MGQQGNYAKMRLEEDLVIRRSRPTMISAKYRAREERRRLLKISAGKLRRIEDPEASLCRSVLINNAVRRLQRENRDEKTRNYGLSMVSYLDDSVKENNVSSNLISGMTDEDASSKKRLGDDLMRNDGLGSKRRRHEEDDIDLQDDVFSDFYILPPSSRLLSHIDEITTSSTTTNVSTCNSDLVVGYHEDRLAMDMVHQRQSTTTCMGGLSNSTNSCTSVISHIDSSTSCSTTSSNLFHTDLPLDQSIISRDTLSPDMMEVADVGCDSDRICDFARFTDSAKTLEERLVELQSLDEHFDLTKFERNNNQSCGRAFHDIQTFHSLVPGLET